MFSITILSSSLAGKKFIHQKDLFRHQHIIHGNKMFKCYLCLYKTARKDKLVSHQKTHTKSSHLAAKDFLSLPKKQKSYTK